MILSARNIPICVLIQKERLSYLIYFKNFENVIIRSMNCIKRDWLVEVKKNLRVIIIISLNLNEY